MDAKNFYAVVAAYEKTKSEYWAVCDRLGIEGCKFEQPKRRVKDLSAEEYAEFFSVVEKADAAKKAYVNACR